MHIPDSQSRSVSTCAVDSSFEEGDERPETTEPGTDVAVVFALVGTSTIAPVSASSIWLSWLTHTS